MGFILGLLLVELTLARLLGVSAVSPCVDPEDDTGSYKCLESTSTTSLILSYCDISDEDVEEGHLASCFDAFGRDAMQTLWMDGSASLTTLPEEIFEDLPALQELRIMYSALTTLPVGIFQGLAGLDMLDLGSNDLTTLPDGIFQDLKNLYYLNLKYNRLTILPDGIQDMTAMELLYMGHNDLTTLPDGILQDLTALRWIDLSWNDLTTLPVELFQNATALEFLSLGGLTPGVVPDGILQNLTDLRYLYLDYNDLTTLPEGVQDLTSLYYLYLDGNSLSTLPDGIFQDLTDLRYLDLSNNELTILPDEVRDLTDLENLNLGNTNLTTLPVGMFEDLTVLEELNLEDTPLECLPTVGNQSAIVFGGPFGTECGCSVPDVTENVCGEDVTCTPGPVGYTCAAAATQAPTTAASPAPTPAPFALIAAPNAPPAPTTLGSPAPAPAPFAAPTAVASPAPSLTPQADVSLVSPSNTPPGGKSTSDTTTTIIGVGSGVGGAILAAIALWLCRRRRLAKTKTRRSPHAVTRNSEDIRVGPVRTTLSSTYDGGALAGGIAKERSVEGASTATRSTVNVSTIERAELDQLHRGQRVSSAASAAYDISPEALGGSGASSKDNRRGCRKGVGVGKVAREVALELAQNCHIPGVSEAATAMSVLVNMVVDSGEDDGDAKLKQCRSIVMVLERAAKVAEKDRETMGKAERVFIQDVVEAIFDLNELIKTYQSKNKLSKVLMSTQFKRQQDELDVVVDRAISRLQLGLQVQVRDDVNAVKDGIHAYKRSIDEATLESLAEARRARRQRKLDQVEISEDKVVISDELLGRGGFGKVFLAKFNGRNAAAKVLYIQHDLGRRDDSDILESRKDGHSNAERVNSQRKGFLREMNAMIRLRSPHTVVLFGAITSLPDRLVLVMELLPGGDLQTLLKNSEQPLPEKQSRMIIGDICAGMMFLHSKETVHGDLKSANVLLDGAGRAKIGDFGTSRWSQHTNSTGLATYTTKSNQKTQMSFNWSAPEVLDATVSTHASDVYSFGIVAWEVFSRELPWANLAHPKDVYIHVVLKGLRPKFPADAPADMISMATACWAAEPSARPTFTAINDGLTPNSWGA
ncbi:unnamed protein product [Ectocarpus sp. 12 AP-2014]